MAASGLQPGPLPAVGDAGEVGQPHQPCDALASVVQLQTETQLGVDGRSPGGAGRAGVDLPDRGRQPVVRELSRRRSPRPPVVETRPEDLQHPAGHRDGHPMGSKLLDRPEPHLGARSPERRRPMPASGSRSRPQHASPPPKLDQLALLRARQCLTAVRIDVVARHPPAQPRLAGPPGPIADAATGSPFATRSNALRQNSGDFEACISDPLPRRSTPQLMCPRIRGRVRGP